MKRVLIIQEHLPHYRVPFFRQLRDRLGEAGVGVEVVINRVQSSQFVAAEMAWATKVGMPRLGGLVWHRDTFRRALASDLVIVPQEVKYLVPMLVQGWSRLTGRPRFAYWGHGRNFQAANANSPAERWKRWLSRRCDWWFAYNERSAAVVEEFGFPPDRITMVGNAVEVGRMQERQARITEPELAELRQTLGITSDRVAVYTGGLYGIKRIGFLLEAARAIRERVPDFHLLMIGDGPERPLVTRMAAECPWVHDLGKMDDVAKVPYWALAKVLLMPGAVGLVVFDSFALGVPMVTTAIDTHGPEIQHLRDGVNGVVVAAADDAGAYAAAVAELMDDPDRLRALVAAGRSAIAEHTIERMVDRFTEGTLRALEGASPKL